MVHYINCARISFSGRHVCSTKLPPKTIQIDMKNGLKKRIQKMIRNLSEQFKPLSRRLKLSHRYFSQVFHRPKFAQQRVFFTVRPCRGSHANNFVIMSGCTVVLSIIISSFCIEVVYLCVHTTDLFHHTQKTLSTAGNSMTSSARASPEPLLKKEASLAVLRGREFWKGSGSLKCLQL